MWKAGVTKGNNKVGSVQLCRWKQIEQWNNGEESYGVERQCDGSKPGVGTAAMKENERKRHRKDNGI